MWFFAAANDLPWSGQLGIAAPFAVALAFVGKWLIQRLDGETKAKDELYKQIIAEVVPALSEANKTMASVLQALDRLDRNDNGGSAAKRRP